MKKTDSKIIWGILFVLFGLVIALKEMNFIPFSIFFHGWWTLFIIIPCMVQIISGRPTKSSFIWLVIGVLLFCYVNGYFEIKDLGTFLVSGICIVVGVSFFFKDENSKIKKVIEEREKRDAKYREKNKEELRREELRREELSREELRREELRRDELKRDELRREDIRREDIRRDELKHDELSREELRDNKLSPEDLSPKDSLLEDSIIDEALSQGKYKSSIHSSEDIISPNNNGIEQESSTYRYNVESIEGERNYSHGTNHGKVNDYVAFFNGTNIKYVDEEFQRAKITSIFGNVQLDLRNAIFQGDSVIEVNCILGGVDINVPSNIRVVNQCTAIMAGVDTNIMAPRSNINNFTLYIKGNCILGGVEIK